MSMKKHVHFFLEGNKMTEVPSRCECRHGTWIRDRLRFQRRIEQIAEVLEPVLREKIR